MANIKNFGIKGVASDIQFGKGGGFFVYDKNNGKFQVTDSGSSLEDIEFATVKAGTWNGTAIGAEYGGLGLSGVAANSIIYTSSANTFTTSSVTTFGLSLLDDADASAGRTTLGLGNVSTQADNAIAFTGGTIDGVTIGGSTAGAITGTTITANSGFSGNLTGDVTGDLTGNVTGTVSSIANHSTSDLTEGTNLYWTTARGNAAMDAYLTGGTGLTYSSGTIDLDNTAVTAGDYGSATQIPTFTVDAQGRITAASNVSVSTGFDIAGDNGSNDTVSGGETLSIVGTAGQTATTITNNQVAIGIVDGASIANLTVTGTFTSDDITSAAISIDGDATITGNLTVQGTQTTVNSTTVETADAIFRTNSNGANTDAGFEANTASGVKQILYTSVGQEWDFGSENVKASTFTGALTGNVTGNLTGNVTGDVTGDLTGNVTGTVSSIANHSTTDLAEGTNLYYTTARANSAMDAYLTGGTGLTYTSGTIDLDNTAVTAGDYGSTTQIPTFTVDAQGRITAASNVAIATNFTFTGDSGSDVVNGGESVAFVGGDNITTAMSNNSLSIGLDANITLTSVTAALTGDVTGNVTGNLTGDVTGDLTGNVTGNLTGDVTGDVTGTVSSLANHDTADLAEGTNLYYTTARANSAIDAYVSGGNAITVASGVVSLDNTAVTAGSYGNATAIPNLTIDAQGGITAASTSAIQTSWTLSGDSGSETVNGGDTVTVAGGNNITSAVTATDTVTLDLDTTLSGMVAASFSANVTAGNLTTAGKADVGTLETSGDATIGGNLIVNGTTTTLSSTNTTVTDTLFELNSGATANANDIGLLFERGSTGDNAFMGWDESADQFVVGTTSATADATGDLTITDANFAAADITSSGTVQFVDLSDGTITISAFVDEDDMSSDSATLVPTQQSVKAYVDSKVAAVDDTVLRASFTADSTNSSFTIGTMPSTAGRSYLGSKLTLKVTTGFSGDGVDAIEVSDGTNTLMAVAQNDPTVTGTYLVDLGAESIAAGATITASFKQSDGSTASVPTAGAVTATVEYQFYT